MRQYVISFVTCYHVKEVIQILVQFSCPIIFLLHMSFSVSLYEFLELPSPNSSNAFYRIALTLGLSAIVKNAFKE